MKLDLTVNVNDFARKEKMKVYLDDVRPAPIGWKRVCTVQETIVLINKGWVTELSIDNDLGPGQPEGYLVAEFIEEKCKQNLKFIPPEVKSHSLDKEKNIYISQIARKLKEFYHERKGH